MTTSNVMKTKSFRPFVLAIAISTATVTFLPVFFRSLAVIPAGHVGVVDSFGEVSKQTLKPGMHLVNPLSQVVKLSTKTKEIKETLEAPSQEGLSLTLDVSILYHLNPEKAEQVYRTIGTNYEEVVLIPEFRSVVRQVTASYDAKALYTSQRQQMAEQIREELSQLVSPRGIVVEKTPLRKLELPQNIQAAVEEKLKLEQQSQQMQFVLQKERQEAERKRIEAKGIADSQRIISQGLNDKLLQLKRIEVTEKVAQSANAKVVIVSAGETGSMTIQP